MIIRSDPERLILTAPVSATPKLRQMATPMTYLPIIVDTRHVDPFATVLRVFDLNATASWRASVANVEVFDVDDVIDSTGQELWEQVYRLLAKSMGGRKREFSCDIPLSRPTKWKINGTRFGRWALSFSLDSGRGSEMVGWCGAAEMDYMVVTQKKMAALMHAANLLAHPLREEATAVGITDNESVTVFRPAGIPLATCKRMAKLIQSTYEVWRQDAPDRLR